MSKLQESVQNIRGFFAEVVGEVRRTSWPDRHELLSSTGVVILAIVVLSLFVGAFDAVLRELLKLLLRG
jgi:preprotein translocase subunit SecE